MTRRRARAAVVDDISSQTAGLPDPVRLTRRQMRRFVLSSVSAAALVMTAVVGFADDKNALAKPAPDDTVICLELTQPDRVIDRLSDPRIQSYLKLSQSYQKFLGGKQLSELRAVAGLIASQLNTTWEEGLRDLTGGGILAEVQATPGQPPRISVLVTARKPEMLEKTNEVFLKLARQDAQQKGKPDPARTSSHRGLTITSLGGDQGIAYCIADGKLLASNSVKNVERLIDGGIELAAKNGKGATTRKGGRSTLGPGKRLAMEGDARKAGAPHPGVVVRRSGKASQD